MKLRTRHPSASKKSSALPRKKYPSEHRQRNKASISTTNKSQLYEVESITKKRWGKAGWEYFASWTGYPPSDDMWISECPLFFRNKWERRISQRAAAADTSKFDVLVAEACRRLKKNE